MANRAFTDIEEDETYQAFVKLANDKRFYLEMKEAFPCKSSNRNDTMYWKQKIINEESIVKVKEKSKGKKKTQPTRKYQVCNY